MGTTKRNAEIYCQNLDGRSGTRFVSTRFGNVLGSAGSKGKGSKIFVIDMGEPVLIKDLAEQMIRLSGLEPKTDVEIIYSALCPGEELFEEIFYESEGLQPTDHAKLLLAKSRRVDREWIEKELSLLQNAAVSRNVAGLEVHLKNIVPEFKG
jgi:FlaA1/EpsC-like NDP-sugar epimerase